MAAVPVRRSLLGSGLDALQARAKGATSRVVQALRENVMTFAGLAAICVGMFHLGVVAGWCAVGVSILLADFKLQG